MCVDPTEAGGTSDKDHVEPEGDKDTSGSKPDGDMTAVSSLLAQQCNITVRKNKNSDSMSNQAQQQCKSNGDQKAKKTAENILKREEQKQRKQGIVTPPLHESFLSDSSSISSESPILEMSMESSVFDEELEMGHSPPIHSTVELKHPLVVTSMELAQSRGGQDSASSPDM